MNGDSAISEMISVILIIALVIALAAIILLFSSGMISNLTKPTFIAPAISAQDVGGKHVISLFNRAGDVIYLNVPRLQYNEMGVYVDTPEGNFRAQPLPGVDEFAPGTNLYIFRQDGAYRITDNTADLSFPSAKSVPDTIGIRLVDDTSHLLLASWQAPAGNTQVPSPTPTPSLLPVTALFTREPAQGQVPLTVQFTDTSSGPVMAWSWTFGDGSTATDQHPVHTYTTAGNYLVTLSVTNASRGADTYPWPSCVQAFIVPKSAFTGEPVTGPAPLLVRFTDLSTGDPTLWIWDFGDGDAANATLKNPMHRYAKAGTYTVSLKAANAAGSGEPAVKTGYISALASPTPTSTVTPTPEPLSISWVWPDNLRQGRSHKDIDVEGTGFMISGTTRVTLRHAGEPDIEGEWVKVLRPAHLIFDLDIPDDALPGEWDLVVTSPDGRTCTLSKGFEVKT